ncbi:filamentous hemagglutinin N-terminal domain-containing protein [Candidatus Halobeggiatoa sp. HSG11]|nr:filamentous hemagglutinin N-terminal domain-containing protein [Candidatus Halobeggiatoa sp. HSG11]
MKQITLILIIILHISAYAEVVPDGTLGPRIELSGPNYAIDSNLGQQHGSNLFHSFQTFNLNQFESATFSGPDTVNNIISRVTDGNPSSIDGLIRSTIPDANMYLLNSAGLMFGPNARLDIQGSFHASTADYLRLGDTGYFYSNSTASDSLLTVAPVKAFGFLDNDIAPISISGSGEVDETDWDGSVTGLAVPGTLSFIGGDLDIKDGTFFTMTEIFDDGYEWTETFSLGTLTASQINLASVATKGELSLNNLNTSTFGKQGNISIANKAVLDTSGIGGGNIFIRGGEFVMDDSKIISKTLSDGDGGIIDIKANNVSLINGAEIDGSTQDIGTSSEIKIQANNSITATGENSVGITSGVYSESGVAGVFNDMELGDAKTISLTAKNISFENGASIAANTYGTGQGGQVNLIASESVSFSGIDSNGLPSQAVLRTESKMENAGDAGTVLIQAKNIAFKNGASIFTHTAGTGKGGLIIMQAKELVDISGIGDNGYGSFVAADIVEESNGGDGGEILIETRDLLVADGSFIVTNAMGPGKGGNIKILASGTITVDGSDYEGLSTLIGANSKPRFIENDDGSLTSVTGGAGGNIVIEAKKLVVTDGGIISNGSIASEGLNSSDAGNIQIDAGTIEIIGVNNNGRNEQGFGSGIYSSSKGIEDNAGKAGEIILEANSLNVKDGGIISSSTNNNASGGKVNIVAKDIKIAGDSSQIQLQEPGEAQLAYQEGFGDYTHKDSVSGIYASSSSDIEGAGQAGKINVQTDNLNLTKGGTINTSTQNAGGGNIDITARNLLYSQGSNIETSVFGGTGNSGNITVKEPIFVVLNDTKIHARADEGRGGNILVSSDQFIASNSSLDASSNLGIDGEVKIDSLDIEMEGFLVILPGSFVNADELMTTPCNQRLAENLTSLVVVSTEGYPSSTDDLLPSGPLLSENLPAKKVAYIIKPQKLASLIKSCKRKKI